MGALRPPKRRPAVKVVVFQWPWGTAGPAALSALGPAPQAGHFGRGAGLIDEDEFFGIKSSG